MCSYGPIVLGHRHPAVEAAARAQLDRGDCQNGPGELLVELAERFVDVVDHADWALFAKNGTDATTACVTVARAPTERRKVLVAEGAYHGAAPWCTPAIAGVVPEDRAHLLHFRFNDLESVTKAVESAPDDVAAIVVSPFKHDARHDQELVDPAFANGLRAVCDDIGAALILDDVRCGFRLAHGGSWEPIGVAPDLSAWSKAIANGYPLAAVAGNDRFRGGAEQIFVTGSFWFAAVPMAAAVATIDALGAEDAVATMERTGQRLRDGLAAPGRRPRRGVNQTGPVQMPLMTFTDDGDFELAGVWSRRRRPQRGVLPPVAQLVPVGRPHRRRHRRGPRRDRPGVRRGGRGQVRSACVTAHVVDEVGGDTTRSAEGEVAHDLPRGRPGDQREAVDAGGDRQAWLDGGVESVGGGFVDAVGDGEVGERVRDRAVVRRTVGERRRCNERSGRGTGPAARGRGRARRRRGSAPWCGTWGRRPGRRRRRPPPRPPSRRRPGTGTGTAPSRGPARRRRPPGRIASGVGDDRLGLGHQDDEGGLDRAPGPGRAMISRTSIGAAHSLQTTTA